MFIYQQSNINAESCIFCLFLENSLKMPKKQTYFSERDLRTMNLLIGLLKQSITPVQRNLSHFL